MVTDSAAHRSRRSRLVLEWLVSLAIALPALFLFFNGSFFSTWGAYHVDLSINYAAAHALRDGADPYGPTTLLQRARSLGVPTNLLFSQLFTSYIQPPTSALSLVPLSFLPWREATRLALVLNHCFLFGAIGVTLVTLRPTLSKPWLVAGLSLIVMLTSQIYGSFTLGQWDALLCLLLALAFWGWQRGKAPVTGVCIAVAAMIKVIPGLLLLYFLWRREYRIVLWGAGATLVIFLLSLAYVGPDIWRSYLGTVLPAVLKGSTQYSNISFGAVIARMHTGEVIRGQPFFEYLDEVPDSPLARLASTALTLSALAATALVSGFGRPRPEALGRRFLEYYLVIAAGLLVSSVTWEFYTIWLLPLFIGALLAPERVLPASLPRLPVLAVFAIALLALNLPGDLYLFRPNDVFFHAEWVPGVWVEDRLRLYHRHEDAVLYLRLPALLLLTGSTALLVLVYRWREHRDREPVTEIATEEAAVSRT
jgi:uncharacterized membrane protein